MNIVLTGFMGTGKSEVGKLLSRKLGWQFFDIDELIEKRQGMKISDIFEKKGENFFREIETDTIKEFSKNENAVIACGGGAVLRAENMSALEDNGVIVCLIAQPEVIYERLKEDNTRPLLKVKDPLKRIKEIFEFRNEFYHGCSLSIRYFPYNSRRGCSENIG